MKLEQFKQSNQKKKVIIIAVIAFVFLISAIVLIRTYAIFETSHEYDVIKGRVSNYETSDITITAYLEGTLSKEFPLKDSPYAVESIECNNSAKGLWNYKNWELNIQNMTSTKTKCKVYFVTQYKETILNGTDPVANFNLIPVIISDDGSVKKADITKQWYSYENKVWANAVILEDESIVYKNEESIPLSNIESYFVYIPRYKYKIFNAGNYTGISALSYQNNAQVIDIVFENIDTKVSSGSTVGSYLTHPAFVSFDTNGLWVGKYETGYKGATTTKEAENNVVDSEKLQIKPNVYSWRDIQVVNSFLSSYLYQRNLDSHMMKNSEWGAVAYLSHSKYGIQDSIRLNNNSSRKTGYSAVSEPTCGYSVDSACNTYGFTEDITHPYNTTTGYKATTTGNISGIYDMSGGSWEYVMAVMISKNGELVSGRCDSAQSGFNGIYTAVSLCSSTETSFSGGIDFPEKKYYDTFPYTDGDYDAYAVTSFGDAIKELGPFYYKKWNTYGARSNWYQDDSWLFNHTSPWMTRGVDFTYGVNAGIFAFTSTSGVNSFMFTFRVVLS